MSLYVHLSVGESESTWYWVQQIEGNSERILRVQMKCVIVCCNMHATIGG